jgi:hypothetical protein
MINSAEGFPVDIVYATPVEKFAGLGSISSRLPRPDMVVTHSRWDVFLPIDHSYGTPDTTMDLILDGVPANPQIVGAEILERTSDASLAQFGQPLRITVPTRGIRFAFEKLYANQSTEEAAFSIRYVSADGNYMALALSVVGAILLWLGILGLADRIVLPRHGAVSSIAAGGLLLGVTIGWLGTAPLPASILALIIAAVLGARLAADRWRMRRKAEPAVPSAALPAPQA